jgi:capsular exopolysaccharide synthesis family protein
MTKTYASTAEVLVKPVNNPFQSTAPVGSLLSMDTERQLASSSVVAQIAVQHIRPKIDPVHALEHLKVSNPTNTQVLEFTYSAGTPAAAKEGADAFSSAYVTYRVDQTRKAVDDLKRPIQTQIAQVKQQLDDLNKQIGPNGPTAAQQNERDTLTAQLAVLTNELAPYTTILVDPGDVIATGELPESPSSPKPVLNAAIGLAVGLLLGVGLAFARERLDERLRSRADVERAGGAPVLAMVPGISGSRRQKQPRLVSVDLPSSGAAEAYKTLRTGVLSITSSSTGPSTIAVTSPGPGEGKSATVANLGVALAQSGKRVILVSADLRRPGLGQYFRIGARRGLSDVLKGTISVDEAILPVLGGLLRVVPSGIPPAQPAELLSSEAMRETLEKLASDADFVLVDCPPVLPVSDALAVTPLADHVILVVSAASTTARAVVDALGSLDQVGARVMGSLFNMVDRGVSGDYPSSYRYA